MEKNEIGLKNKVIYFVSFHRNSTQQSAINVTIMLSWALTYLTLPFFYDNI